MPLSRTNTISPVSLVSFFVVFLSSLEFWSYWLILWELSGHRASSAYTTLLYNNTYWIIIIRLKWICTYIHISFLCDCICIQCTLRAMTFSTLRQQITPCNTPISITLNKLPPSWPPETEHVNTWRDVYITRTFSLSLMTITEIN